MQSLAAEAEEQNMIFRSGKKLLYDGDFKEMDRIGRQYIEEKLRLPGGDWKLKVLSDTLTQPRHREDPKDWEFVIGQLEKWHQESETPFSLSMLGRGYLNYGKNARGDDFASEVPEDQWPKMRERVAKAETTLLVAKEANPKDPEVYRNLLHAGILNGWPRERMNGLIKEANSTNPTYYHCHYNMCFYLMERWHGEKGDWQRYLNSIQKVGEGDDADIIYTKVGIHLYLWYQSGFFAEDQKDKISWNRMKRGFNAMMAKYPNSPINLNQFFYFACKAKDRDTAREKLKLLDDKNLAHSHFWGGKEGLEAARNWTAEKTED